MTPTRHDGHHLLCTRPVGRSFCEVSAPPSHESWSTHLHHVRLATTALQQHVDALQPEFLEHSEIGLLWVRLGRIQVVRDVRGSQRLAEVELLSDDLVENQEQERGAEADVRCEV